MRTSPWLAVLIVVLAGSAAGCETTKLFQGDPGSQVPERRDWQETEPLEVPSVDVLWERARAVLEYEGYALDEEATRYDRHEMVTQWVVRLAPGRLDGIRRRVHLAFVPSGTRWVVRAAVLRQRNADIDDPTNPAQAQWERTDPDASRTGTLIWKIRAAFDPALSAADPLR